MLFIKSFLLSQKKNLKNLSGLIIINFIIMGLGFLTKIVIANSLGKAVFGQLAYGMALGTVGMVVVRFGLDRTLVRELIHYPEKLTEIVRGSLVLRFILFFIFLLFIGLFFLISKDNRDMSLAVLAVAFSSTIMALDLQPVYDAWHQMNRHAIYNLCQKVLYLLSIWIFILLFPEYFSLNIIGLAMIISVLFYMVLQHNWVLQKLERKLPFRKIYNAVLSLAKENILVYLAAVFGLLSSTLNQLLTKHMCGDSELGSYSAAWLLVTICMTVMYQVARIGGPAAARNTKGGVSKRGQLTFIGKYCAAMLVVSAPVGLLMLLFPSLIISIIFKSEYLTAIPVMRILGGYIIIFSLQLVFSQYIIACRMEQFYFVVIFLSAFISIVLCYKLIPAYHGIGAALALMASEIFILIFCMVGVASFVFKEPHQQAQ